MSLCERHRPPEPETCARCAWDLWLEARGGAADPNRCPCGQARCSVMTSESQGGGPRTRCLVATCVRCKSSWIQQKESGA